MEREFNEACLQCPLANRENPEVYAQAAGRILARLEEITVGSAVEGEILRDLVERVENQAPTCEEGPRKVFVADSHRPGLKMLCGQMNGVVVFGKTGVEHMDFRKDKTA